MCGIAAFYAYHYAALPPSAEAVGAACEAMRSRGPDGEGQWRSTDGRAVLGHRRLAIIDLSESGAQPMADGDLVVTFNGEIYNWRELRAPLEAAGKIFRSHSDTEVLLHLYREEGERMVSRLRGMFAFAIWDARRRSLFLARDPYGIKPLYFSDDGWTFRAASQVKALLRAGVSRTPEPAGAAGFFLWGSVPEPYTLYREIRELPAGSWMTVDETGPSEPRRYFSIARVLADAEASGGAPADVSAAVTDSVRHHLVSDVPVGVYLSAGVDSAALAGVAADEGRPDMEALTLSFEEFKGTPQDETPGAAEAARRFGLRHHVETLTRADFDAQLADFLGRMDQPSIDGANTYFVSRAARAHGWKVALSGLGADELFGGYPSFRDVPRWSAALAVPSRVPLAGAAFRGLHRAFARGRQPKEAGLLEYGGSDAGAYFLKRGLFMPWELGALLGEDAAREGLERLRVLESGEEALTPRPKGAFARVAALEASLYMRNQLLRDADWAGMAHSMEIRTPFVDAWLLRALAPALTTPARPTKEALAKCPSRGIPPAALARPKTGFLVPIERWLDSAPAAAAWKRVPSLAGAAHWSRRWACAVYAGMTEAS